MGILTDLRAYVLQITAPVTVRYGTRLVQAGGDLPRPAELTVPTRHGTVRCEVYRPADAGAPPLPPVYVHLHGGAFVMRHPRMDDFFARHVAARTGAVVVNVDYDVAPQVRFPVAQEQAHDVAAWLAAHGEQIGVDGTRVAVGGFSAGGNLAAAVALQARDLGSFRPALQLLGVPVLDVASDPDERTSPLARPMIGPAVFRLVRATYFRDVAGRRSPYASPLLAPDLAGLAPAMLLTAEYDVLRGEGDRYAVRLAEAGVPVDHVVVPGRDHYFLDGSGDGRQAGRLMDAMAQRLADAFAGARLG